MTQPRRARQRRLRPSPEAIAGALPDAPGLSAPRFRGRTAPKQSQPIDARAWSVSTSARSRAPQPNLDLPGPRNGWSRRRRPGFPMAAFLSLRSCSAANAAQTDAPTPDDIRWTRRHCGSPRPVLPGTRWTEQQRATRPFTNFKTGVPARAGRRVRFPSPSANRSANRGSRTSRSTKAVTWSRAATASIMTGGRSP
jgi:hypothetical protein